MARIARPKNRAAYVAEYAKLTNLYSTMSNLFFGVSSYMGMDRSIEKEIENIMADMTYLKKDYKSRYGEDLIYLC